jgi:RNA polymerase sigma factor (sigma-70 family)
MATRRLTSVLQCLHRATLGPGGAGPPDGELLRRFLEQRDGGAFEALLRRHGPMVLGVCRRVLGNEADAEDAFQATFLLLARKAACVRPAGRVGSWLHGVAYRTALKARTLERKRRAKEAQAAAAPRRETPEAVWRQLQTVLDQELQALPEKYRAPITLCDLEGRPLREAAQQLGWPQGTVATRLTRGRALLAARLARHGLELPGEALAVALSACLATAPVRAALASSTVKVACLVAVGQAAAAGAVSARVAALTAEVGRAMSMTKLKMASVLLLALLVAGPGAGVLSQGAWGQRSGGAGSGGAVAPKEDRLQDQPVARDHSVGGAVLRDGPQLAPKRPATDLAGLAQGGGRAAAADDAKSPALALPRKRMAHAHNVLSVAFSPDGKALASGSRDETIKLWDAQTGQERATLKDHRDGVHSVAFSPDGKVLASGGEDKLIKLWDVKTGRERATLRGHTKLVWSVAFSPDGKVLASGSADKTVKLWDVAAGLERATLKGHTNEVRSVAFSPDGKVLASGSADKTIKLWDAQTGQERATLKDHRDEVRSVAFSPDGKVLASASADGTVKPWDARTGRERATLKGHRRSVLCVAFSPGGQVLASGDSDGTLKVWDAQTGQERASFKVDKQTVLAVAFSPDGTALASANGDHTIKLWDMAAGAKKKP